MTSEPKRGGGGESKGSRSTTPRRKHPIISDLEFEKAGPEWDEGFLGWASLNVAGLVRIHRIDVRLRPSGALDLGYPISYRPYGVRSGVDPVDWRTHHAIVLAIREHLRLDGPGAARRRGGR